MEFQKDPFCDLSFSKVYNRSAECLCEIKRGPLCVDCSVVSTKFLEKETKKASDLEIVETWLIENKLSLKQVRTAKIGPKSIQMIYLVIIQIIY